MAKTSLDDICVRITAKWRRQVQDIIEIGKLLLKAKMKLKEELGHGNWLSWVDSMKVEGRLPFDRRGAQKYKRIAEHLILSDANCSSHLPACLSTLDKLVRLPADDVLWLIRQGAIHSDMSFDDAVDLVAARARPEKLPMERDAGGEI